MQIHWPLVVSTVCQRVGLGMFICAFLANPLLDGMLPMNIVGLVTLALLCVGGLASLFHLQKPQRFFNAFSNMKSHLTQEALLTPFLGIALLACGLNGLLYQAGGMSWIIDGIAAALSLAFLVCTGLAYQMGSRPAWNTGYVLALFLATAAQAGSIAVLALCFTCGIDVPLILKISVLVLTVLCLLIQIGYIVRMRQVGYGVDISLTEAPYRSTFTIWIALFAVTLIAGIFGVVLMSAIGTYVALAACSLGIGVWTVLFFKGALKVKMFPMYPVDLNLDM